MDVDGILGLVDIAVAKAKEVNTLVEAKLSEDWLGRKVEVR